MNQSANGDIEGVILGGPSVVVPTGDGTGEGAIWSARERAVYWTDINRFLVHRYDEASASVRTWLFDEPAVALSLTVEPGRLLVALGSRLIHWWPADDSRQAQGFVLPQAPSARLNDGRSDPAGNFWVGSMSNNVGAHGESLPIAGRQGKLFRIGPGGDVKLFRDDLVIANTLCWSPDRTRFYFADTGENVIWEQSYDVTTGEIGPPRVFFTGFERGSPDGSAMDSEGYLWNCRYGGGCVVRVAPDGRIDHIVDMPVSNITTCVFGGDDLKTLYITTARQEGERLSGSLYCLRTDVAGQPENLFRG